MLGNEPADAVAGLARECVVHLPLHVPLLVAQTLDGVPPPPKPVFSLAAALFWIKVGEEPDPQESMFEQGVAGQFREDGEELQGQRRQLRMASANVLTFKPRQEPGAGAGLLVSGRRTVVA